MAGNRLPVRVDLDTESPAKAIRSLELPSATLYLIDKVVRAKALYGPIGVDNSEVINIEAERELRQRNRYIAGLYGEKQHDGALSEGEDGPVDEDGFTQVERENLENEHRKKSDIYSIYIKFGEKTVNKKESKLFS